jgi:flagella basal body P-ring formation protein FlgA
MRKMPMFLALIILVVFLTGMNAYSEDQSFIEAKISDFIKKIYNDDDELQIKFGKMPAPLKGRPNVKNMSFAKVPDAKGDGVCLVEIIDGKNNRDRSVYVPFRTLKKTKVYILTNSGKKSDVLRAESVTAKETHFNEKKPGYPSRLDDIVGRTLKKDVAAGTVITYSMLDDPVVIQKGEVVNIVAENKKLLVRTKGKAMEKGRMGDSIRVKNALSEKEVFGKVVDDNTVLVKF